MGAFLLFAHLFGTFCDEKSFFAEKQKVKWVGSWHYDVRHLSGAGKDRFTNSMQVLKGYIEGKILKKTNSIQIEFNENAESRLI